MARAKRTICKLPVEARKVLIVTVNDLIREGCAVGVAVAIVAANSGLSEAAINKYRRQYKEKEPPTELVKQRLAGIDTQYLPPARKRYMSAKGRRLADLSPVVLEWIKGYRSDWPNRSISMLHREMIGEFSIHQTYLPSRGTLQKLVSTFEASNEKG